jgi:hypothetical protein
LHITLFAERPCLIRSDTPRGSVSVYATRSQVWCVFIMWWWCCNALLRNGSRGVMVVHA